MTRENERFPKATFLEDAIENMYSKLQNAVHYLTETNCNLNRPELPDRERCVGRCISFRAMNTYTRCNHRADFKRLCKYHIQVCEIIPIGYHSAEDVLGELHSKLMQRFGYLARGIAMTNPNAKHLKYLFENNTQNIFHNGRTIDTVAGDWETIGSYVSYASVIDMIETYEQAVLVYLTLSIIAEMRGIGILLCHFNGRPDLGHYRSFAQNSLLADKIGQFLGMPKSYSDLRFRVTDVIAQMDKIERIYLASKYITNYEDRFEFIRSSIPYEHPELYQKYNLISNNEGKLLLEIIYYTSKRHAEIRNSRNSSNPQLDRFDMLDVFEELVQGHQPLTELFNRNVQAADDTYDFILTGPSLDELYTFMYDKARDYEAHSAIAIL